MFTSRNNSDRPRNRWDRVHFRRLHCESLEDRRLLAVVTVDTNQDVVDFNDGVTSLREAIFATNLVAGADEIQFDFGHDGPETIVLTMGELAITDSLTITGPGAELLTIDASGNDPTPDENNGDGTRVFDIDDGNLETLVDVEIRGLTLTGGDVSDSGGVIFSIEDLSVSDSTISGNSSGHRGGGIYNRFGTTTITDSTVSENSASSDGGGIWARSLSTIELTGSTITGNSTGRWGGGAYVHGTMTIADSTISGNSADTAGGGIAAGNSTMKIADSTISGNSAGVGGGIWIWARSDTMSITASTISGNSASSVGGGIYSFGTTTITDTSITGNSAGSIGGGIWVSRYKMTIIGSTITGNSAGEGGAIYAVLGATIVTGSTISNNSASSDGGGIFVRSGPTIITDSTITGNSAGEDGGGIKVAGGLTITGSTITGNSAGSDGGGVHSSNTTRIIDSTISDNSADRSGGGIWAGTGRESISGSTISGNSAGSDGGGIWARSNLLAFADSTISGNSAGSEGGGIWASFTLRITSSTVSGNSAGGDGGGIYSYGSFSTTTIARSTISGNSAGGDGGGIWALSSLVIANSTFSGNSAGSAGGGINSRGRMTITDSTISLNMANLGGGINSRLGTTTITGSTISDNSAGNGGGIWASSPTTIIDSTISGNSAGNGGGIWAYSHFLGTLTITNSTISGNSANNSGGGVFFPFGGAISHSTIANNISDADESGSGTGGGLFARSGTLLLDHTIVAQNTDHTALAPDISGLPAAVFDAHFSLIGDNVGSLLTESPVGSPDANGNLIGGPIHGVIDPLLGDLADNDGPTFTHALLPGSPAINRGDLDAEAGVGGVPLFDQRGDGFDRVFSSRIDIGAFEVQEYSDLNLLVDTLEDESDGDFSRFDLSLREAIELANDNPVPDTISFDPILTATLGPLPPTILLTMGELAITDDLTINGLGEHLLTIDGSSLPSNTTTPPSTIFNVDDGNSRNLIHATIAGLTLTGGQGSAIRSVENLTVESSTLHNNQATEGGAIHVSSSGRQLLGAQLTIRDSTISNNLATGDGGGVFFRGRHGTLIIEDSTIEQNSAGSSSFGGGVYGGGFDNEMLLEGVLIAGNSAWRGGGISITDDNAGLATIVDSVVTGNVASTRGGGLFLNGKPVNISRSTITNNTALDQSRGGGMYMSERVNVTDSTIANNEAGAGGGIWVDRFGALTLTGSEINGNRATGWIGGGIGSERGVVTVRNSEVAHNISILSSGGGIGVLAGSLRVEQSTISDNSSGGDGGGVWARSATTVTDSTIADNVTDGDGGGIYLGSGKSFINGTTVSGNSAVG